MFHGSFNPDDVTFLLQPLTNVRTVTKEEKEQLIAEGQHYSDFIVSEDVPSTEQHIQYIDSLAKHKKYLPTSVNILAHNIVNESIIGEDEIILISLVRAGTPLGVLLKRAVQRQTHKKVYHYGVSIIRDRGIDEEALKYIMNKHRNACGIYFVDGWTGKGTITRSLRKSLEESDVWFGPIKLVVYADPAHTADLAVTDEDLVLPFGILNSTVAGLISRTVYQENGYHGVHFYENLKRYDLTNHFIEEIDELARSQESYCYTYPIAHLQWKTKGNPVDAVNAVKTLSGVTDDNKIKPSISECTRALLRRVPREVYVSSRTDPDLELILTLCEKENVQVIETEHIAPYKAIAVLI
jgi:hypothetical protein